MGNPNDPDLMVRCYAEAVCNGDILFGGSTVSAADCCTQFGNSLRTPSNGEGGGGCHRCISKNTLTLMSL